jgi:hypothetical protein
MTNKILPISRICRFLKSINKLKEITILPLMFMAMLFHAQPNASRNRVIQEEVV